MLLQIIRSNEKEMLGVWKRAHIIISVLFTQGFIVFSYSFIYLFMATTNTVLRVNEKVNTAET